MSLFNRVKETLQSGKDFSASLLARKLVKERFSKYGTIRNLFLDSKAKQIQAELLLQGETEPLLMTVQRYELVREGADCWVIIHEASASRTWLTLALRDFVVGRRFSIPPKYCQLVGVLL